MSAIRKKLIEVSIPLEAINAASAREKSIRHGHPSTLHLWWARRPLAACRAVLFAQLVDDPSSWPDRFPTEEAQDVERRRLHRVIEDMVPWEASNNEAILNAARWEITRSVAWGLGEEPPAKGDGQAILDYLQTKAPPVYDPFSGGGSIPLEAQRLGLRAYGSDLNPVAVLIGKALVEIPPKFAGKPPVNPKSRAEIARGGKWNGKGAQGLAEDVRYYGQWMRDEAERRIGHFYPKAKLPDGTEATVIAWLWARTVRSPDPAAKGAMVPLVSSFMLSTKEGKKAWVEVVIDPAAPEGWRFEVKSGSLSKAEEEKLKKGTKGEGRGSSFACVLTGAVVGGDHIKAEGMAGRMDARLMAVVAEGNRQRVYLSPALEHESKAKEAEGDERVADARVGSVSQPVPSRLTGGTCYNYGLTSFDKLFTPRQLVALTTFSDLVNEAREKALAESSSAGLPSAARLAEGGTGAEAYADAVATYLGLIVGRCADAWSTITSWASTGEFIRNTFARQALPMVWDYSECNPFSASTGNFNNGIDWTTEALEAAPASTSGAIVQITAQSNNYPIRPIVISTDPPYYDNIGYADLSDYFYVWHRRTLSSIWPELYRRLATPKDVELVATPYRHGGKETAEAFFIQGMGEALTAMRKAATDAEPIAIYYAFKQSEAAEDGLTSAGWASFLQAIVDVRLVVDGTWPVRTERGARTTGIGANALASSIVLVCRKRGEDASVITRADFIRLLRRELPAAIDAIRKAGVGPVDMQQSVIGPGMGVFSRHAKVLENDDSAMPVKTALSLINRVWEEIDQELDAAFDAETQVALAWFATYGFDARASGELITLANAKNIGTNALFDSGVFKDLKGKTALTPREELPTGWTPASDKSLTVWECVQHTARVLNAEDGGGAAAGRLVAEMGPKAAEARALAYRLFEIATQKGWAAEALIYNELAQEWPKLEDLAVAALVRDKPAQADMFEGA
jgi:putative DNA methylase